jgi:hypothetical protein
VGTSADGKSKYTDGQVWGSLSWLRRVACDVSIVNPTAVSHSGAGACGESFLNPNAGTRAAEETKLLCQQRGMDFVPIVFTKSGGIMIGQQFQRRYWNPHSGWIRVAEEDGAMKIGPLGRQEEESLHFGRPDSRSQLQTVTPA